MFKRAGRTNSSEPRASAQRLPCADPANARRKGRVKVGIETITLLKLYPTSDKKKYLSR
jgi:hypothetical protein